MAMTAKRMYAQPLSECKNMILANGAKQTVLLQGHMGIGKSALLSALAEELPNHIPCYFDCTTKDLGDITIPDLRHLDDGSGFVRYLTNEELGAHNNQPIILMVDEYLKSNPSVKLALTRVMYERKIGSYTLHPDSIIFATTNLGEEGVGDLLAAHGGNRLTVVEVAKPKPDEWIEWGISNGIDPIVLAWARNNDKAFADFRDVQEPDENDFIYHPRSQRAAFVTPRSLETASDWFKVRDQISDGALQSALIGCIGESAAADIMAHLRLADQLPTWDSIISDPDNAIVPTSPGAVMMVVYKALSSLDRKCVNAWMTYMQRLAQEAQAVFVMQARQPNYKQRDILMTNENMRDWFLSNNHLFTADKR